MKFEVGLPEWAILENQKLPERLLSLDDRMAAVIRFAELNFKHETGGPFAAGVFEKESGKCVVIGVNRVVPTNVSSAHAEIVTLSVAQQILQTFDLGGPGMPEHQLVVNGRPCAMCFGSIPWSGVRSVAIGASGEQIEAIAGFDEGPIHPQWQAELQKRGIEVIEDILNKEAVGVFQQFRDSDQPIYNGRSGTE
jgi:tRNA(Arg) A34 adenosine deaminase TadA